MYDRVPASGQAGRVKITPEGGGTAYYAKLEMADNPSVEGTPLNKANLLTDLTALVLGLSADNATPNNAFIMLNSRVNTAQATANGRAQSKTGHYTGTGTYGEAHPCSVSLPFSPDLFIAYGNNYAVIITYAAEKGVMLTSNNVTLAYNEIYCEVAEGIGIASVDWWNIDNADYQLNRSGQRYEWIAIGRGGTA